VRRLQLVVIITLAISGFAVGRRPTAPDFTLPDLEGHQVVLGHYRGQVVLVNFWATWCAPCRTEIPDLMKLQAKYGAAALSSSASRWTTMAGTSSRHGFARSASHWAQDVSP